MALIHEDGSIVTDADALITLVYFKAYADAQGWDYSGYSDAVIEPAIRRGSQYISSNYSYGGTKTSRDQSFSWPRYGATDGDGYALLSIVIPPQVQKATCEAAWRELVSAGSLNPDVTLSERVKSEGVGPLNVSYADLPSNPNASRPDIKIIRDLLRGLLAASGGAILVRS